MSLEKSQSIAIDIERLTKTYSGFCALDDVSLNIRSGEFISLLGSSGSGKTTLLMALAGFVQPDSGSIRFGGREMVFEPPHKRDVGMMFQNYALFPHMNVFQNVAYPLKLRGHKREEIRRRVHEALATVELDHLVERRIDEMSGGQRQRIALARAIVFEPKILLMDEPLSALDKRLRETMQLEIRRLHERLGMTVVYVTHDQVEAMTLADKVVVLNSGRVDQVGSPLELYHQPANLFVAGFLGTPKMGFLKGKVTRVEAQSCELELDAGGHISLPLSSATLSVGSAVTLGIRPEHLEIASPGQATLTVTADVGERLGSDTFCHVITASKEPLTLRIRGDMASQYGETLHLHLDPAHCHLFDTDGVAVARPLRAAA